MKTYNQKWRYVLLHGWTGIGYGFLILTGLLMLVFSSVREAFEVYWEAYPWVVVAFFALIVPRTIRRRFPQPQPQRRTASQ